VLTPDTRITLLDALRPPAGYQLGCAVGTTFSLNLDAALTAPAAFALHAVADAVQHREVEPLELLDSIRRHAGRYTIFYQAGQIPVPSQRRLFAYLEGALIPVVAPNGGAFHPKVWVLRFDAPDAPSTYRMLCSSRNLTLDRSWDTMLRLDAAAGTEEEPTGLFDASGLVGFLQALPDLAVGRVARERRQRVLELADELAEVTWVLPPQVESGRCIPLGLKDSSASLPFPATVDQLAVISPFLSSGLLKQLPTCGGRRVLVSRPDQLDACATAVRSGFGDVYVLDPDASPPTEETVPDHTGRGPGSPAGAVATVGDPGVPFEGLHAKVFVFDHGRRATVLTGSANATTAAFGRNVEFVCELTGPRSALGVNALMADPSKEVQTLRSFLVPHRLTDADESDDDDGSAEDLLDQHRRAIAAVPITARATVSADEATPSSADRFELVFSTTAPVPVLDDGIEWRCWPITLNDASAVDAKGGQPLDARFTVSLEGITAFLGSELRLGDTFTRFVLTADLVEAPQNRLTRLLRLLIGDAERFLRYLLMLLSDEALEPDGLTDVLDVLEGADPGDWYHQAAVAPLLEALLRTLARDPGRLEQVRHLIDDLRADPEGQALFLPHLLEIWEPIWAAAKETSA
jgi:hypothetical protein